jgi:EmrB/QacA subfamily drug resistance transporter
LTNPKPRPCDELIIRATPCAGAPAKAGVLLGGSSTRAPSSISGRGSASELTASRKQWVLTAAVLGSSMAFIDQSVVNVALPKMEAALAATLPAMTWVINAYTLCVSALMLIGGAAADQLGRRAVFTTGIGVFALASLGCGLAPNVATLIGARAVQGVGAALLVPCSLAIIGATFEEHERGAAIGVWSGASAAAAGAGPLLGGWLVDHWTWRAIFLINPALAAITLTLALRYVPESRDPQAQRGLDWQGAALAFGGLGSLVYGLIATSDRGWASPLVLGALAVGVALLAAFLLAERRTAHPMMPLDVFRSRTFSGVNLLTLFLYGALGGAMFFLPFLVIQVHGYSATAAGAVFLPFTLVLATLSRWGGRLGDRFGARLPLIVGPAIVAAGFGLLSLPGAGGAYWATFLAPMILLGLGMAVTVAPLTTAVLNSVAHHRTGVASGINNAVSSVASLLLIAILGSVGVTMLHHFLDRNLTAATASTQVRQIADAARGGFVMPPMPGDASEQTRQAARSVIAESLVDTTRIVLLIGAGLALASSLSAAVMIRHTPDVKT